MDEPTLENYRIHFDNANKKYGVGEGHAVHFSCSENRRHYLNIEIYTQCFYDDYIKPFCLSFSMNVGAVVLGEKYGVVPRKTNG